MTRQRSIKSLLIAVATGAITTVADGQVVFFGKLDADMQTVRTSQPGTGIAASRIRIATNASRFGARGSLDAGGGVEAVWQIATRVNVSGTETGGGGGLFTLLGNTRIGVRSVYGTVFLGMWDTPFRQSYDKVDLFDNSHIASPIGVLGSIGNGIGCATTVPSNAQGFHPAVDGVSVASTAFHRRQKSSLQYWSPMHQQLQIKLAFSVDDPANKSESANPALWSFSATYDGEWMYLAAAYEIHQDLKSMTGANIQGTDRGTRLIGMCRPGDGRAGLVYELLEFGTPADGTTARTAVSIFGSYQFGDANIGVVYTWAGDLSGTVDTGANQWSFRCGYFLTSVVELYAECTFVRNRTNGTYNFGDGLNIATGPGAILTGIGAGMAYAF